MERRGRLLPFVPMAKMQIRKQAMVMVVLLTMMKIPTHRLLSSSFLWSIFRLL